MLLFPQLKIKNPKNIVNIPEGAASITSDGRFALRTAQAQRSRYFFQFSPYHVYMVNFSGFLYGKLRTLVHQSQNDNVIQQCNTQTHIYIHCRLAHFWRELLALTIRTTKGCKK